jgi:hypothetical protein
MPIHAVCDHCAKIYNLSSTLAGKRVTCKACGRPLRVPEPATQTPAPASRTTTPFREIEPRDALRLFLRAFAPSRSHLRRKAN